MHTKRTLETTLKQVSEIFPIILVTGPRQVGKTTLLQECAEKNRNYVSLDDLEQRSLAQTDPALFLQTHTPPLIIDEAQYAPQLFSALKIIVDRDKQPGAFWLTGSQKFHLMQDISETLAGRVAILDMLGFSQGERQNRGGEITPFLPTKDWIRHRKNQNPIPMDLKTLYEIIWRGSFPKIALNTSVPRDIFYNSYIQTYIQRDVRALTRVGDEMAFARFLSVAAARTGQVLNYMDMARDVDVNQKTIKSWISILETSGLLYLLHPYHNSVTKRLSKTPKLYFLDTGLCSYLTRWSSPETLSSGAMSGSILETFMLSEILKSYWHNGLTPNFYFYHNKDQKEIDLLIEQDGTIYPVEFKRSANPSLHSVTSFKTLKGLPCPIGPGAIVCLKETDVPLSQDIIAIPVGYL